MKVHLYKWVFMFTLLIIVALLAACGGTETAQPTAPPEEAVTEIPEEVEPTTPVPAIDGEALLQQKCTGCHNLNRVTNKAWSLQQWEQNVTDMVRRGARLNAEEKEALVKYLAETYGP
jgi:cytochrome c5